MKGGLVADGWESFASPPQEEPADGDWVKLPENGWGALVAHVAGPGSARPNVVPLEERTVAVHCMTRDGEESRFVEPMSEDDLQGTRDAIVAYLADVGVPPPPYFWWEVRLRKGVTLDVLAEAIDQAFRADGHAPADGVTDARHELEVMRRVVPTLLA